MFGFLKKTFADPEWDSYDEFVRDIFSRPISDKEPISRQFSQNTFESIVYTCFCYSDGVSILA